LTYCLLPIAFCTRVFIDWTRRQKKVTAPRCMFQMYRCH